MTEYNDYTADVIKEMVSRFPAPYKTKPKFNDTMEKIAYLLTDTTGRLKIDTNLQTATGYSLDVIGARFGVARNLRNDDDYRDATTYELLLKTPDLTAQGMTEKIKAIFNIEQLYLVLIPNNTLLAYINFIELPDDFNVLSKILPGGVNLITKYTLDDQIFYLNDSDDTEFGRAIAVNDDGFILATEDNVPICGDVFEERQIHQ